VSLFGERGLLDHARQRGATPGAMTSPPGVPAHPIVLPPPGLLKGWQIDDFPGMMANLEASGPFLISNIGPAPERHVIDPSEWT
jgi:hypothetical protein